MVYSGRSKLSARWAIICLPSAPAGAPLAKRGKAQIIIGQRAPVSSGDQVPFFQRHQVAANRGLGYAKFLA